MVSVLATLASLLATCAALPQGPNTVADKYPNLRTASYNGTTFIVPIDRAAVEAAVRPLSLLAPESDRTLFPNGFPAGKYPVLVTSSFENDIRMGPLQIQNLIGGQIAIPYVDRLRDGQTPFLFSSSQFVGGAFGQDIMSLIPSIVGSLEGTTILPGQLVPNDQHALAISPTEYSFQVKQLVVPNPISGPGVILEAIDARFFTDAAPPYPARAFLAMLNRPLILTNGLCQNNIYYYNESFAGNTFRTGEVKLYEPQVARGFGGTYNEVKGFSGNSQQVGFNAQSCQAAAANIDPSSFEP